MKNQPHKLLTIVETVAQLNAGKVVAYPTEAVFGLGCDPDCETALLNLLTLKHRPIEKGLILIASDYSQLTPYIDDSALSGQQRARALASWSNGEVVTWIFPKNPKTSRYLTGGFETIAVRVTSHPLVKQLCLQFGKPLVSTSANLSGHLACKTVAEVAAQFGDKVAILAGEVGQRDKPSEIRDIKTGLTLRAG
ncbi:Sua5/YciO/YrdC/YwlC family protein [Orbaceae bacterium ESL0721]|nr:Sua5/YciO/YrdC/YwlC family protein [Orbaceae bacterium ESL0721]